MGHAMRSCALGMRIGQEIGLSPAQQRSLYYALLFKDAGCSSNASRLHHILQADEIEAKRNVKTTDWTRASWESLRYALDHVGAGQPICKRVAALSRVIARQKRHAREMVQIRCERGASIARHIGLSQDTSAAIFSLDEHWDGKGHPQGLKGERIPLLSRILNVAQTLEVFYTQQGPTAALEVLQQRNRRWFDPQVIKAAESLSHRNELWTELDSSSGSPHPYQEKWGQDGLPLTEERIDSLCLAFSEVIDTKSPFTYRHSRGVAAAAVQIGRCLSLDTGELRLLHRAALLHDIGKLGVSNSILDKPGRLTEEERMSVNLHPFYTYEILRRIPGFEYQAYVAAAHHERLDGSGYFQGLGASQLSLPARILAVADVYDALSATRPYRNALPREQVTKIMLKETPHALDAECVEALAQSADLIRLSSSLQQFQAPSEDSSPEGKQYSSSMQCVNE